MIFYFINGEKNAWNSKTTRIWIKQKTAMGWRKALVAAPPRCCPVLLDIQDSNRVEIMNDLDLIQKVFGKVSFADSQYLVHVSAKHYKNITKVFIPNVPYLKKIPFIEPETTDTEDWVSRVKDHSLIKDPNKTSNESNFERSLRRTKTTISDIVLSNEFDLFPTFTIDPKKSKDRQNPDIVKRQISDWIKNQQKRNGKFEYLIVPELHKDGKALHFHGLFKGYKGVLKDSGKKVGGRTVYNFKSYTLGHNYAIEIYNLEGAASYIKKYITKDMPRFKNKNRFWASKGLDRPKEEDNPKDWYKRLEPLSVYENDYGIFLTFERSKVESEEA